MHSEFEHAESDVRLRDTLMALDTDVLAESTRIFANARNTASRLARYNGLAADHRFAQSLGDAGYDRARAITWDGVVDRLLGSPATSGNTMPA